MLFLQGLLWETSLRDFLQRLLAETGSCVALFVYDSIVNSIEFSLGWLDDGDLDRFLAAFWSLDGLSRKKPRLLKVVKPLGSLQVSHECILLEISFSVEVAFGLLVSCIEVCVFPVVVQGNDSEEHQLRRQHSSRFGLLSSNKEYPRKSIQKKHSRKESVSSNDVKSLTSYSVFAFKPWTETVVLALLRKKEQKVYSSRLLLLVLF